MPRYKDKDVRKRYKIKYCEHVYPNGEICNKEFYGYCVQKYCDVHRKIIHKKKRPVYNPLVDNQRILLKGSLVQEREFICALPGCNNTFRIKVYPKIEIYPKYCEKHRNIYRRKFIS